MPLSTAQRAYVRSEVGDTPPDGDLDARYDRLGSPQQVVMEVLRERLTAMMAGPAQFDLPGQYSQNMAENIRALERKLTRVATETDPQGGPDVLVSRPARRRNQRT